MNSKNAEAMIPPNGSPAETREQAVAAMIPPPEMNFVGTGDFKLVGNHYLEAMKTLGGLQPHHRVLDVGCGIGRMAIPLTGYLDYRGSYEGFDIRGDGIQWCQEKIAPRYPRFRFRLVSLQNSHYLPDAKSKAEIFHFPYPSRSFDFVTLTSVFTHVNAAVVCNYLEEINRVLKKGGKMFATFFLFAHGAPEPLERARHSICFPVEHGHFRLMNTDDPAAAIAFDEAWVAAQCERRGLQVRWPVHRDIQDIVVAEKKRSLPLSRRWRRLKRRLGFAKERSLPADQKNEKPKPKKGSSKTLSFQVMWPQNGRYSPQALAAMPYPKGRWISVTLYVPPQLPGTVLRVDPCEQPGSVRIAALELSPVGNQKDRLVFQGFEDVAGLKLDSLELLPEPPHISFMSQGKDPKIFLPPLTKEFSGVPLQLRAWVRFERMPKPAKV
jgi:ubiquinone/menaquinone biosynthesis C-methylase UbiE